MGAKDLNDLINKYTDDDPHQSSGRMVSFSTRISAESKIKLDALSAHLGVKKTPLFGEIAEAAINEMYDRLEEDMTESILREVAEEMEENFRTGGN